MKPRAAHPTCRVGPPETSGQRTRNLGQPDPKSRAAGPEKSGSGTREVGQRDPRTRAAGPENSGSGTRELGHAGPTSRAWRPTSRVTRPDVWGPLADASGPGPTVREVRSAPHLHARHPARPPPPSAAEVPPRALPEPVPTACAPQVSCAARPIRRRAAAMHDHDVKPPSSTTSATRGWLARRGRPSAGLRGPAAAPWACTGEALRPAALARHAACLVRARCRSRDAQARACEVWVWGSRSSGRAASPGARRWRRRRRQRR